MKHGKNILLIIGLLLNHAIVSSVFFISDVINNTDQTISFAATSEIKIITCKSIITGENRSCEAGKLQGNPCFPAKTITSLEGASIPHASDGHTRTGISIGFGNKTARVTLNNLEGGYGFFAFIRVRNNKIEAIFKDKIRGFANDHFIPISENLVERNYILEVNSATQLRAEPRTKEKIESYLNPGRLKPQELLHQAITNDSSDDIQAAINLGANVNEGIAQQPPLLLAVIAGKYRASEKLLKEKANPNITYQGKPLFYSFIPIKTDFMILFLNHGLELSSEEKKYVIDQMMFHSPYRLNDQNIEILSKLGYNLKTNFQDHDLSKNKWYQLLKNNLGSQGIIDQELVKLFLKNSADTNQIFNLPNGLQWTPILLVIDSYFEAKKRGGINDGYYQNETLKILEALLAAGGNLNLKAMPLASNFYESPLSYTLKYDEQGYIIDFLTKNGASVEEAVELFLKSGGTVSKKIKYPYKNENFSLLWWAVEKNSPKAVQLLVNAGLKDDNALKFAISKGYSEIISILMNSHQ